MENDQGGFDHTTHVRNKKTGKVESENLYSLTVKKVEGVGAVSSYERPMKSGIFYHANGKLDEEKSKLGLAAKAKLEAAAIEAARVAMLSPEAREQYEYEQALAKVKSFEEKKTAPVASAPAPKAKG